MHLPADLHVHTTFSDSTLTPEEVIGRCVANHVGTVAITDHDALAGVGPATEVGREAGVRVVPGGELTAYDGPTEIHILGLFIDPEDRTLRAVIELARQVRYSRVAKIVRRLRALDVRISSDEVLEVAGSGVPGRMHVAQALVNLGQVASIQDAFKYYLGNQGPAYAPKHQLSPAEAAAAIHSAGGVSVVAHPGVGLPDALVREMVREGIRGIEVYHPLHSTEYVQRYLRLAAELGALVSGGSDSHGGVRKETHIGSVLIDDELVERIEQEARARR